MGFRKLVGLRVDLGLNTGILVVTCLLFWGVPDYKYSIIYHQTLVEVYEGHYITGFGCGLGLRVWGSGSKCGCRASIPLQGLLCGSVGFDFTGGDEHSCRHFWHGPSGHVQGFGVGRVSGWYGGWTKSCMTLRTLNYGNYGIFLIMGHAGFCPSTVCLKCSCC